MVRWEPDARGRLEKAAHQLFADRGFAATTAADIARAAGVTERTFFRHYADKREVLFSGSAQLQEHMVDAVTRAPATASAMAAVAAGVHASAEVFANRREYASRRQAVVNAHPELRERELIKLASLAVALAGALRERGVGDPEATLAAEAGVLVFRLAFDQWLGDPGTPDLATAMRELFGSLAQVTAGG